MDETRQKQNYLRTEIIEQGLDAGDFIEYIAARRENGRRGVIKATTSTTGAWLLWKTSSRCTKRNTHQNKMARMVVVILRRSLNQA